MNPSPILKGGDDHNWSKRLLLGNHHVILHAGEDGGLHKETLNEEESENRWKKDSKKMIKAQSDYMGYIL